jgi:hypothetical protein
MLFEVEILKLDYRFFGVDMMWQSHSFGAFLKQKIPTFFTRLGF